MIGMKEFIISNELRFSFLWLLSNIQKVCRVFASRLGSLALFSLLSPNVYSWDLTHSIVLPIIARSSADQEAWELGSEEGLKHQRIVSAKETVTIDQKTTDWTRDRKPLRNSNLCLMWLQFSFFPRIPDNPLSHANMDILLSSKLIFIAISFISKTNAWPNNHAVNRCMPIAPTLPTPTFANHKPMSLLPTVVADRIRSNFLIQTRSHN